MAHPNAELARVRSRRQDDDNGHVIAETEPLLGGTRNAKQPPHVKLFAHLYSGFSWISQLGGLAIFIIVWAAMLKHPFIPLFTPHPLLQSLGLLTLLQAILILQPTRAGPLKLLGARTHARLNLLSFCLFAAGLAVIETNKIKMGPGSHFKSLHGYLGIVSGAFLLLQYLMGFLMWGVPGVLGGLERAKKVWKYHRWSGYVLLVLLLATTITSSNTDFVLAVYKIPRWSLALLSVVILVGVFPQISLAKLGLRDH